MPILIPYNADAVTEAQTLVTGGPNGAEVSYRLPVAAVVRGRALRLNSGGIEFGDPPPLRDMPDVPAQLRFLSRHHQHQCGVWAKYARRFVERYFAFVEAEIAANLDELGARLAPFGTLYEIGHWSFSALRPLPRAHLPVGGADMPPALVAVEIAFWTAAGAVAIDLVGRGTRVAADNRRRERLEAAGVRVVEVSYGALDDGHADTLAALLPADFSCFWRDDILPMGPFRTASALDAEPVRSAV